MAPLETQIRFGADDEETARLMQAVQLIEVDVAPIHDVEGAGLRHQHVEDVDLVPLAVADVDEARDVASEIEQRMHPDGGLGRAKRRPRKHRQAQVDGRGVQGIDGIGQIDAKGLVGIKPAGDADQVLREVGMDAPVAHDVGVRQRVPPALSAKPSRWAP